MEVESYLSPISSSLIKKGMYILLDEKTCKVTDVVITKTGKHGHMKVNLVANEIFGGKKHTYMCAGHNTLLQVEVKKNEYQVLAVYSHQGEEYMLDYFNENSEVVSVPLQEEEHKKHVNCENMVVTIVTGVEGKSGAYVLVSKITEFKREK
jgi:translation elongation factor P/translation initiation factor 5A